MRDIYWRPQGTPLIAFVLIALFSVGGMILVERMQVEKRRPHYSRKVAAAKLTLAGMEALKGERLGRGATVDRDTDPSQSGLVGSFSSAVTSDAGDLAAKQTTINPNFAALVVQLLEDARVGAGDTVAVSFSGSFPALNIAVLAALRTLQAKPVIISSASASQWGANDPKFLWIDMERVLRDEGVIPYKSAAVSLGGKGDRGQEMTEEGRSLLLKAIQRNDLPVLLEKSVDDDINRRMEIYYRAGAPKAYINVGGGVAAAGVRSVKVLLKPGLLSTTLPEEARGNSVVSRFLHADVPVIHLGNVKQLANHYGLPLAPQSIPAVGEGNLYFHRTYNSWLAGAVLLSVFLGLYGFSRTDWGFRLFLTHAAKEETGPPEPMI
jgi:poly-gamma-glutamate system protein